jgi:hypothetical protein
MILKNPWSRWNKKKENPYQSCGKNLAGQDSGEPDRIPSGAINRGGSRGGGG